MRHKLKAFSILELAMVLAILSLLIGMVWASTNRFQDQMKISVDLSQEMTEWYRFRSNFWREINEADSVQIKDNHLLFFHENQITSYTEEEQLTRTHNGNTQSFPYHLVQLTTNSTFDQKEFIVCQIEWKEQRFNFTFPLKTNLSDQLNTHYTLEND